VDPVVVTLIAIFAILLPIGIICYCFFVIKSKKGTNEEKTNAEETNAEETNAEETNAEDTKAEAVQVGKVAT
jgi:flagellar basal body-associated protein FliL